MKTILLTFLNILILLPFSAMSQSDIEIHGNIKSESGEPLTGITVFIEGTSTGSASNTEGHYQFNTKQEGEISLIASGIGFKSFKQKVTVAPSKTTTVNFKLKEDILGLEQVVVSANREATNRKEASVPIQVVGQKILGITESISLADGLKFQSGIRVENNCQNCGFSQVRINGMEGAYSQILIDGRAVFSALNGVYGLEQIPSTMIERIEVIRGGGSSLYGGNAIAGTINVITKEPISNELEFSTNQSLVYGQAYDYSYNLGGNIVSEDSKYGLSYHGFFRDRDHWDYNNDGFSEIPEITNGTFGLKGFLKASKYDKVTLEGNFIKEDRRGGNKFELAPHEADIAEALKHTIWGTGVTYEHLSKNFEHKLATYISIQNTDRESYYGAEQDANAYGTTDNFNLIAGARHNMDKKVLGRNNTITTGVEYRYETIDDILEGYNRSFEQTIQQVGIYTQSDWQILKKMKLLAGFRVEYHNLIDQPIIMPRANIKYDFNEHIRMRAGYARGFRAPQAFDEDLHLDNIAGDLSVVTLADNLTPEYSNSYTYSLDYDTELGAFDFELVIDAFYTQLNNTFINETISKDIENNLLYQEKRNGGSSIVKGVSFTPQLANKWMSAQAGVTFQKSEYDAPLQWSDNEKVNTESAYQRTPDLYGFYTLSMKPLDKLSIDLSGNYTGSMWVPHYAEDAENDELVRTPDFFDHNIKIGYKIPFSTFSSLTVSAGVKNIFNAYQNDFDRGVSRDGSYVYGPMLPRTFFVSAKLNM